MRVSIATWLFLGLGISGIAAGAMPRAAAQDMPCPGGRVVTGFDLAVAAPGQTGPVPFGAINNLDRGDVLHYAPQALPKPWQHSARIATILIPAANEASEQLAVFTGRADRPAAWTVPARTGAVAFLFGPDGLNARKTRSLLTEHPELVMHFIAYADEASRVEALVALLARYEDSPPGALDLNAMLKQYSATYGVSMPKADPTLLPGQEAAVLLAAVAPPTAQSGTRSATSLTLGSTSTATALASLYFGPVMGIATDTLPLFRALHQSLFPGTQFQGAFADIGGSPARLCAANTAPPPNQHTVYIWTSSLPGGATPVVRLAATGRTVVAAGTKATIGVTCASVAQLRELHRARQWELIPAEGSPLPVAVEVAAGPLRDTLTLDLSHTHLEAGDYRLAARWDWAQVNVAGAVTVRAPTQLAAAKLATVGGNGIVAGSGDDAVTVTGDDFSFVDKVELVAAHAQASAAPAVEPFSLGQQGDSLSVNLATAKLAPGGYQLRLDQTTGGTRSLPLTILPPNPTLQPIHANLDEGSQRVELRGEHLEHIVAITSPDATVTLDPLPQPSPAEGPDGMEQRQATVTLGATAAAGQSLSASVEVAGVPQPLALSSAIEVLGPRPRIGNLNQTVNAGETVSLLAGELPADATVNFAFTVEHAPPAAAFTLRCESAYDQIQAVELHVGETSGSQELDAGGGGLYYLAAVPGKIGALGCRLQMIVTDAATGDSDPYDLGRVVQLPRIHALTLSDTSPAPGQFAGVLSGDNLQLIAKTGWSADSGVPVASVPMRVSATSPTQTLAIAMPWPPPAPHAPLYIWLRGETRGRPTTVSP